MKNLTLSLALLTSTIATAQNVGINNTTPHPSAILDIASTNKGLLIPRLALTSVSDVITIPAPLTSLMVYNTATAGIAPNNVKPGYYYYDGTKWVTIGGGDAWMLTGNAGTSSTTNFVGTTDNQDLVFKTNSIENMRITNTNNFLAIGTTTPSHKLSVYGTRLDPGAFGNGIASVGGADIFLEIGASPSGFFPMWLQSKRSSDNSPFPIALNPQGGNVGVGTIAPANKLEITQGTPGNSGLRLTSLPSTGVLGTNVNGDVVPSTINPANALFWGLTGNSGTTPATNFVGTTDNQDLVFKRNNLRAGLISLTNTSFGSEALNATSTGNNNSAFGYNALLSNTTGIQNVAVGSNSLYANTVGIDNTAVGYFSLYYNTTGTMNTAIGAYSLLANTTGSYNTAIGRWALTNNTASDNIAIGYLTLRDNTTGTQNIALGNGAMLKNTASSYNMGLGLQALAEHTSGDYNTAVGYEAMQLNTTGIHNATLGYLAGYALATGNDNTFLGSDAAYNQTAGNNNIAIGYNTVLASLTGNNQLNIGNLVYGTGLTGAGAGNVGIGIVAPSAKLQVLGTSVVAPPTNISNFSGIRLDGNIANISYNGLSYQSGGGGGAALVFARDLGYGTSMSFFTNPTSTTTAGEMTERMIINSNGNVGIGTTTPSAKLDIAGGTLFANQKGYADYFNPPGYDQFEIGSIGASTSLSLVTNGVSKINITPIGYVGIGTLIPSEKLEVNGSIKITDGTQGAGKVLTSDAAGKATWQNVGSLIVGTLPNAQVVPQTFTGANVYSYSGASIVLPAGKWIIYSAFVTSNPNASGTNIQGFLSSSSVTYAPPVSITNTYAPGFLKGSILLPNQADYNVSIPQVINVASTTIYYIILKDVDTGLGTYSISQAVDGTACFYAVSTY